MGGKPGECRLKPSEEVGAWSAVSNGVNESSKSNTLILEQRIDFLIQQLRAPSKEQFL